MPAPTSNTPPVLELGNDTSTATRGRIWTARPSTSSADGLLTVIGNTKRRQQRVPFASAAFSARGDAFSTVDELGAVVVYHVLRNGFVKLKGSKLGGGGGSAVAFVHYRPTSGSVVVAYRDRKKSVVCLDTHKGEEVAALADEHRHPVFAVSVHPSRPLLLTVSTDCAVLWDSERWTKIRVLGGSGGSFAVGAAQFAAGGRLVAALFRDDSILLWDTDTFAMRGRLTLPPHEGAAGLRCFAASPDGKFVVAGGANAMLYKWDVRADEVVSIAELHPSATNVVQLEFVGEGEGALLACLGDDGRIVFLDFTQNDKCKVLIELFPAADAIVSFSVDPHGKYLAACTSGGTLRLYDLVVASDGATAMRAKRHALGVPEHKLVPMLFTRSPQYPAPPTVGDEMHGAGDGGDGGGGAPEANAFVEGVEVQFGGDDGPAVAGAGVTAVSARPAATGKPSAIFDHLFGTPPAPTPPPPDGAAAPALYEPPPPPAREAASTYAPLYRLTRSDPKEAPLSATKLRSLLKAYGEFPSKHRALIWRFLLKLPDNAQAFDALAKKGPHPAFADLHNKYPVRNQRLFAKFKACLSAVAHWSPIFGEVEYLPSLAFPFVVVMRDDLPALEAVLCVLLHWQSSWCATFPHPPLLVLSSLEQLLELHDAPLAAHFAAYKVDAQQYGWRMLRSAFTEVLTRTEWLRLWDHLLSADDKPELLVIAAAAYCIVNRSALLQAKSADEITPFFQRQNPVNMGHFLALTYRLHGATPSAVLHGLVACGPSDAVPAAGGASAAATLSDFVPPSPSMPWPLPSGGLYPLFHGYPKFVVDFQLQERERLAHEKEQVLKQGELASQLLTRAKQLEAKEKSWAQQQDAMLIAEAARKAQSQQTEAERRKEVERLDELGRQRRLRSIEHMETSAHMAMETSARVREAESQRLTEVLAREDTRREYEVKTRLEEEALLDLETLARERVSESMRKRGEEELVRNLRADVFVRQQAMALSDKKAQDDWRNEDEQRELKSRMELEHKAATQRLNEAVVLQREMERAFVDSAVQRDVGMAQVERTRRLRHLQVDEKARQDQVLEARAKHTQIDRADELLGVESLVREARSWRAARTKERMDSLTAEQLKRQAEVEAHSVRALELEKGSRMREIEEMLLKHKEREVENSLAEEKELQEMLLRMEEERSKERLDELRLSFRDEEQKRRAAFQQSLQDAEQRVLDDERRRFDLVRDQLRQREDEKTEATRAVHGESLGKLERERRAEVDGAAEDAREEASAREASRLVAEYQMRMDGGEGSPAFGRITTNTETSDTGSRTGTGDTGTSVMSSDVGDSPYGVRGGGGATETSDSAASTPVHSRGLTASELPPLSESSYDSSSYAGTPNLTGGRGAGGAAPDSKSSGGSSTPSASDDSVIARARQTLGR